MATCELYFCLVLSEAAYYEEVQHLKVPHGLQGVWISHGTSAQVSYFENEDGRNVAIVSFKEDVARSPIDVACILVHEAVHIWQHHCENIGERHPSREYEAYGIESIAKELMNQYVKQRAP